MFVLTGIATWPNDGYIGITTSSTDQLTTEASCGPAEVQQVRQRGRDQRVGPGHQRPDVITHLQATATVSATVAEQSQSCTGLQRRRGGCRRCRRRPEVVVVVRLRLVHIVVANDAQRCQDAGDVIDTGRGYPLGTRWSGRCRRCRNYTQYQSTAAK